METQDQGGLHLYDEKIYVDRIPDNFSCPICLCPVQRSAHLAECCGNHFCFQCISRVTAHRGACPMCKCEHLKVFPNKERQREVDQLRVRCPFAQCSPAWEGALGALESHLRENHQEAKDSYLFKTATYVDVPPAKFGCSACSCLVQRAAQLTLCCGTHFCLECVNKVLRDKRPCPACGGALKAVPNKERQREINQLKVRCPFPGECASSWEGELSKVEQHIGERHQRRGQGTIMDGVADLHLDPENQGSVSGSRNGMTVSAPGNVTAVALPGNGTSASQPEVASMTVAMVTMNAPVPRPSTAPVDFSLGGPWSTSSSSPDFNYPHDEKPWCGPRGHHHRRGRHGHHPDIVIPHPPHPHLPPPPHSHFPRPPPPSHPDFPPPPHHPDFPPPHHPPFGPPPPHHLHHGRRGHHGHHGHHHEGGWHREHGHHPPH